MADRDPAPPLSLDAKREDIARPHEANGLRCVLLLDLLTDLRILYQGPVGD